MIDPTCSLASHRVFVTGFGPSCENMQRGWRLYLQNEPDLRNPTVSPLYERDLHNLPPTMVITAEYDPLRDEGELYAQCSETQGYLSRCAAIPVRFTAFSRCNRFCTSPADR
jgi:acetyl esterase/lipase